MKRFAAIILVCAFFAAIFATQMRAQPAAGLGADRPAAKAASTPAASHAEPAREMIPSAAPELFTVLGFPVTNSMVCTWIVAVLIILIVRATTWKLKEIPTGGQNLMETVIEIWQNLMSDILDKRVAGWVFPFATTFFIFIILSNFVDLIPGVGSIGFGSPDKSSVLPFAIQSVSTPFFRPPRRSCSRFWDFR